VAKALKYVFLSLVFIFIQMTVLRLISLNGIIPDIILIWVVFLSLKQGQTQAVLWGFGIGLFFDFLTGSFIGLSAFTKMLAGFTAGFFYNENKFHLILGSYRFLLIVFIVSLIHNVIYFTIFTRGSDLYLTSAVLGSGIATTLYTVVLAALPMFIFARKYLK
jgi:rod shape-determining protein MreD